MSTAGDRGGPPDRTGGAVPAPVDGGTAARIRSGLVGFAAGDALGTPWEGAPPGSAPDWRAAVLGRRRGWPAGSTSDDTDQMLLVAEHLVRSPGNPDPGLFLAALTAALPRIRGAGPSTRAAVRRYVETGTLTAAGGDTNGAVMRALPFGWAVPPNEPERRRRLTVRTTRTTHGAPAAVLSACVVAALASAAVDGARASALVGAGLAEAEELGGDDPAVHALLDALRRAAEGRWVPSSRGVPLDAAGTTGAVLSVLAGTDDPVAGMQVAVALGGDTDTAAAIVGGLLGCREATVAVPWSSWARLPDPVRLDRLAAGLADLRDGPRRRRTEPR